MKYTINLIRQIRLREKRERARKSLIVMIMLVSIALLLMSAGYAVSNVMKMNLVIENEKRELARIEAEYRKYKETRMIVDKADIELLDRLQNSKIFWTKKLAAMAFHLPNKQPSIYWITEFGYRSDVFNVKGYGFITPKQEQLITIDDYLNCLRNDSTFNDVFVNCYLNKTERADEGHRERVTFDYSAEKPKSMKRRR